MSNTYSKHETGHTKNLENFKRLYAFCDRIGASYNPVLDKIKTSNMQTLITEAEAAHKEVFNTKGVIIPLVNERQELYQPLEKLSTRIVQALQAATDDKRIVQDARQYVNKIHGKFPKSKTNDNQAGQETERTVSNSQQSFDKLREHLEKLIILLENVPAYVPNETELQVGSLRTLLNQLVNMESQITVAFGPYNDAMNKRDYLFYQTTESLVPVAQSAKTYLKSLLGIRSTEYQEISRLQFKTYKR